MSGFGGAVPGDEVVADAGLQAAGDKRGDAGREAVEEDGPARSRGSEYRADESGNLQAADTAEAFKRVGDVDGVGCEGGRDGDAFALDSLGIEAGAAAAHCLWRQPCKGGKKCSRDRGVADTDIAKHDQIAASREIAGEYVTDLDRLAELFR